MCKAQKIFQVDMKQVNELVEGYRGQKWSLIPLVQQLQEELGFIPPEAVPVIAGALGLFPSEVQGVISFYAQLYTEPRGKNVVRVCRGTACHVRGGKTILKLVKQQLALEEGETTEDLEYTLETVACIGVCALAPTMVVGNSVYGNMNPKKVGQLFKKDGDRHDEKP
jgi:NADH:ubiquinone oxidoreductase subunit E